MKVISEIDLTNFKAWSGARDSLERIIDQDKENEVQSYIEDAYPDGIEDTALNDFLWFDAPDIFNLYDENNENNMNESVSKKSTSVRYSLKRILG